MNTTLVSTWVTDIGQLGPIYPFVGTELIWYFAGLIFWLSFHVLQGRIESRELAKENQALSEPKRMKEVLAARDHPDRF